LRADRAKMRELKRELRERAAVDEFRAQRWEKILTGIAQSQGLDPKALLDEGPPRPPSPDEDPIGHLKGEFGQMLAPVQQMVQQIAADAQERAVADQVKAIEEYHESDARAFEQQAPDYNDAEVYLQQHLFNAAVARLEHEHPEWDEEEVQQYAYDGLQRFAAHLQHQYALRGESLAARVYHQAQQFGYRPRGTEEPRKAPGGQRTARLKRQIANSAGAAASKPASRSTNVLEKMLTPGLMDDDEFDELTSKPGNWKKLAAEAIGA
jgi:hypothetical protein